MPQLHDVQASLAGLLVADDQLGDEAEVTLDGGCDGVGWLAIGDAALADTAAA